MSSVNDPLNLSLLTQLEAHAGTYLPDFLPRTEYALLKRYARGEMMTVDSFVVRLAEVPCTAGVYCPLCRIDAGEETPNRLYDPGNLGQPLTSKSAAFYDQTTFVTISCCEQAFHRGYLFNMWLHPSRMNPNGDMPLPLRCALCRREILDSE